MTARAVLLLGLLLVALAACVDPSAAPTPTATEPASDRPTGVSQASATSAATGPEMMATIPPGMEVGEVVRVVDGDTAMIEVDGQEERVRYIGINAPESAIQMKRHSATGRRLPRRTRGWLVAKRSTWSVMSATGTSTADCCAMSGCPVTTAT